MTEEQKLRNALAAAHSYITSPCRMVTFPNGNCEATYRANNYNRLTAQIREALGPHGY